MLSGRHRHRNHQNKKYGLACRMNKRVGNNQTNTMSRTQPVILYIVWLFTRIQPTIKLFAKFYPSITLASPGRYYKKKIFSIASNKKKTKFRNYEHFLVEAKFLYGFHRLPLGSFSAFHLCASVA